MATFCTKCGAPLGEGASFCTKCGTSLSAESAATPPPPTPPLAHQAAAAPSPSGSGSGLKIFLIVLAVFVGLGILFAIAVGFGIWQVARNVDVDTDSGKVSISTPGGEFTVGEAAAVSEADLGVPLYPSARQAEGSMQMTTPGGGMNTYVFKTGDAPAEVMAFYRQKLDAGKASFMETPEGGVITSGKDRNFMITIGRDSQTNGSVISIIRRN